ncbi:hypothetical protein LXD69_17820 [Flavobacterium sediminilitoris]|uniref:DUF4252 domain-containing protein n=1 Tax=Flavobacterium sediminilitoris TaxID=2024526 RepID=A0ABY4HNS3_9FLAO|nr:MULTISPECIES: hypothetical protein [Flavobacterium]UOX33877.1 hypothetical protein LXD69_17820 [Flavobacterium sediminilitoris]
MKSKFIFLSILFVCTLNSFAQDLKSLKTEALKAYKASATMDYDLIFETTYPKVFDIIPKESMKDMFGQMMENEQFSIKLIEVDPNFSFGTIKKIGNQTFCLVDHDNVMTMKFKTPMEDAEGMIDIFKNSMDAKNVIFEKEENQFKIELRSTLIAVADESTKNKWKFLNKDKENQLFNMIFDEKIKTELGL